MESAVGRDPRADGRGRGGSSPRPLAVPVDSAVPAYGWRHVPGGERHDVYCRSGSPGRRVFEPLTSGEAREERAPSRAFGLEGGDDLSKSLTVRLELQSATEGLEGLRALAESELALRQPAEGAEVVGIEVQDAAAVGRALLEVSPEIVRDRPLIVGLGEPGGAFDQPGGQFDRLVEQPVS